MERKVFRPRLLLSSLMAGGGVVWMLLLGYLASFDGVPPRTWLSVVFFVFFFALALLYYARTAIFVEGDRLTYRGLVRTHQFLFADVRRVHVLPGPVTVYSVRARGRLV